MKELVRRALRRAGYDLRRFLPTTSPDAQLRLVLERFGIGLVLDVGANTGQYVGLLRELGYAGAVTSFEPLAAAYAELAAAAAADPRWTVHARGAIGDRDGDIEINVAGNSVSSSVLPMLETHAAAAPASRYTGRETVALRRLDSVMASALDTAPPLLVKIDTQGFEAAVIAGAPLTLARAAAVQLEVSLAPLYDGQPTFEALLADLQARGLVLWALWPGFADPASGRLLQADAIFARPERLLEA